MLFFRRSKWVVSLRDYVFADSETTQQLTGTLCMYRIVQIIGHCWKQDQMFSTDVADSIHMLYCTVFRTTDLACLRHCKERALFANFNPVSFRERCGMGVGIEVASSPPPPPPPYKTPTSSSSSNGGERKLSIQNFPFLLLLLLRLRPLPSSFLSSALNTKSAPARLPPPSTYKPRLPPTLLFFPLDCFGFRVQGSGGDGRAKRKHTESTPELRD